MSTPTSTSREHALARAKAMAEYLQAKVAKLMLPEGEGTGTSKVPESPVPAEKNAETGTELV